MPWNYAITRSESHSRPEFNTPEMMQAKRRKGQQAAVAARRRQARVTKAQKRKEQRP